MADDPPTSPGPQGAVARPEQEQETAGRNRASTVDLLNSPVMILQPESEKDLDSLSRAFETAFIERTAKSAPQPRRARSVLAPSTLAKEYRGTVEPQPDPAVALRLLNVAELLNEGATAIVDDSFTKCFKSTPSDPWNWNVYLFPMWCVGCLVRHLLLFPLRLTLLLVGFLGFLVSFFVVHVTLGDGDLRRRLERSLTEFMCSIFVASWTGVVKYHGPRPTPGANKVYVANHTSMIDFIILQQVCGHSVIMQQHSGWVGWLQGTVLQSIGCIQFDRKSIKDRSLVAQRLRQHVADATANPLLIFPEGTCVNNEYCVLFKKGAFDLGARVYPVAIKYNKIFVDAFWNSKRQSFSQHLYRLMTSWAVVCDVWYMEPQDQQPGETAEAFAERVQGMICRRAGITRVKWDGMLKYYRPRGTLTEKRRAEFAREIMGEMGGAEREAAGTDGAEGARDGDDGGLKFRTNAAGGFNLVASAGPTD